MEHPDPNQPSNFHTMEYSAIKEVGYFTVHSNREFKEFVRALCTKNDTTTSQLIKDLLDDFFTAEEED